MRGEARTWRLPRCRSRSAARRASAAAALAAARRQILLTSSAAIRAVSLCASRRAACREKHLFFEVRTIIGLPPGSGAIADVSGPHGSRRPPSPAQPMSNRLTDECVASGCSRRWRPLFTAQHQVAIAGNSLSAAVGCCRMLSSKALILRSAHDHRFTSWLWRHC